MDADPVVAGLSDPDPRRRQEALYQALSERRADLVPFIQTCAVNEPDPDLAVLAAQVALSLVSDPPDETRERQLRNRLVDARTLAGLAPTDWLFLIRQGRKSLLAHVFKIMGSSPPSSATPFLEAALQHHDPDIRSWATVPAAHSMEGTIFAHLLSRTCDPDRRVARAAFIAIQGMPAPARIGHVDRALRATDQWVVTTVATFLPMLASKDLEPNLIRLRNHPQPMIAERAREALHRLEHLEQQSEAVKKAAHSLSSSLQTAKEERDKGRTRVLPPWQANPEPLPPRWSGGVNEPPPAAKSIPGLPPSTPVSRREPAPQKAPVTPPSLPKGQPSPPLPAQRSSAEPSVSPLGNPAISDQELLAELEGRGSPATPLQPILGQPSAGDFSSIPIPPRPAPAAPAGEAKKLKVSFRDKLAGRGESTSSSAPSPEQPAQPPVEPAVATPRPSVPEVGPEQVLKPAGPATASPIQEQKPSGAPQPIENANATATPSRPAPKQESPAATPEENATPLAATLPQAKSEPAIQPPPAPTKPPLPPPAQVVEKPQAVPVAPPTSAPIPTVAKPEAPAPVAPPAQPKPQPTLPPAPPPAPPAIETMDLASAAGVLGAPAGGPPIDMGIMSFTKTSTMDSILQRYPSFISRHLERLFMPDSSTEHLRSIRQTLEGLLGFLNFAFLQAYLFYATKSPKGDQTVKETLKAHLLGPNASRHLHHLALAIKDVKGNDRIFTFPMAKVITEPSEANPLFILKEMYDAVLNPTPEVMESLEGIVEQLGPMLVGFKGIISNRLIMRMPPGAREPFLDLTGPQSAPLSKAQQPELDLPPSEPIILSSDRGEALGLFPYFTFDGQGLVFGPPDTATFATLLERLSLSDPNS